MFCVATPSLTFGPIDTGSDVNEVSVHIRVRKPPERICSCHDHSHSARYIYKNDAVIPASWQSGFNSISSAGQFFGGFLCSWMADRIGRRCSLLVGLCFVTGGIFGEVFSYTRPAFLIGKLILGIGLGFYLTIGPLYCSEVAPVVLRGIITGGINFAIVIGQLLSNAVIKSFGGRDDQWAFRGPFAIQWLFVGNYFQQPLSESTLTYLNSHPSYRAAVRSSESVALCSPWSHRRRTSKPGTFSQQRCLCHSQACHDYPDR